VTLEGAEFYVTRARIAGRIGWAGTRAGSSSPLAIVLSIVACVLLIALMLVLVRIGFSNRGRNDDGYEDGGRGGGGNPPDPGPSDRDPSWWPDFERQLADYGESLAVRASDDPRSRALTRG
jgi:hypothetical protein